VLRWVDAGAAGFEQAHARGAGRLRSVGSCGAAPHLVWPMNEPRQGELFALDAEVPVPEQHQYHTKRPWLSKMA